MRYLITTTTNPPFFTAWFDAESHFAPYLGMIVYDLVNHVYTTDGKDWLKIKEDQL